MLAPFELVKDPRAVMIDEKLRESLYRFHFWEEPVEDGLYVIGGDTALGIEGRDLDVAEVFCKHPGPLRQVAEVAGTLGERFERVIYWLCRFYNDAFLLMERQTLGLAIMRRLYDDYHYQWIYWQREHAKTGKPTTDLLGHHKGDNDLLLWSFRRAFEAGEVQLRSGPLLDQMFKLQFRESTPSPDGTRGRDEDLKVKLPGGGSPDMVMAAMYGYFASTQVQHYPRPKADPIYEPGTMGHALGHNDTFDPPAARNMIRRRR